MRADRTRPTLIYDGECGFCQRSVDLLRRWDRERRIALVPFQDRARVAAFHIPLPALAAAMHLVLPPPDGRVLSGADAVPERAALGSTSAVPAGGTVRHPGVFRWQTSWNGTRFGNSIGGEESLMTAPVALSPEAARTALRQVKDPELDMNIVDLGLVYDVETAGGEVRVKMTLTSPGCPAGPMITNDAYRVLRALEGVKDVDIEIVWEPYWTPERMDPKVRALMGL